VLFDLPRGPSSALIGLQMKKYRQHTCRQAGSSASEARWQIASAVPVQSVTPNRSRAISVPETQRSSLGWRCSAATKRQWSDARRAWSSRIVFPSRTTSSRWLSAGITKNVIDGREDERDVAWPPQLV